jgi:hypothetical protein
MNFSETGYLFSIDYIPWPAIQAEGIAEKPAT